MLRLQEGFCPKNILSAYKPYKSQTENAQGQQGSAPEILKQDKLDPLEVSAQKIAALTLRLGAMPANQRAGSPPNIGREVLDDDDTEFQKQASAIIVEFIKDTGLKKGAKRKIGIKNCWKLYKNGASHEKYASLYCRNQFSGQFETAGTRLGHAG
ncbi:hypothetical protein KFV02_04855 [Desulfohalobiaceae bacterium Ax17]|uniref:hypothetical protein n=1 Tax=Desulfovulcanus ferrireducens TaxID=2831190 RepID=UPI00207BCF74|nr:hypothetical protein [Desulfovulcanus ferrireducens]MBT8763258.1 hypothetical protein [Desulfovulcanus ferrireducens]